MIAIAKSFSIEDNDSELYAGTYGNINVIQPYGKDMRIEFSITPEVYKLVNSQSPEAKEQTRESLKNAVENLSGCIGTFFMYLDGDAFDVHAG